MNKYDELVQKIDHLATLLCTYRVGTDKGYLTLGNGGCRVVSTIRHKKLSMETLENLHRDLRVAILNLYDELLEK